MVEPVDGAILSLLGALLLVLFEALRRRDGAAVANALVALVVALLPEAVEVVLLPALGRSASFGPELTLWIAVAGLLHAIGMLGPYDSIRWWDSLTHGVSAALVAALCYAGLLVTVDGLDVGSTRGTLAVATVLFTIAAGVFWELIELVARDVGERFDVEPVLVHYGRRDTALDLVFDLVGALLVVALDLRVFVPVADQAPGAAASLVLWSGAVVVLGSIAMALGVRLGWWN